MFLVGDRTVYGYIDLVLANGSRVHFNIVSPGISYTDGVLEHLSAQNPYHKARISWNEVQERPSVPVSGDVLCDESAAIGRDWGE